MTVDELMQCMTAREFLEWQLFMRKEAGLPDEQTPEEMLTYLKALASTGYPITIHGR